MENNDVSLKKMADAVRFLSVEAVKKANCGHPGMPMGAADFATVLFSKFLKIDPKVPEWQNRDRLVLSAGHGSMLLYAIHHLIGYKDMTLDQIKNFRQLNSVTPGHPEYGHTLGIETTTGPLGQGISTAVGMAIAERILNSRFGDDIVDHNTYVIASDGDLMEGISHEAIGLAGHLGLSKLIVLYDSNNISIDGSLDLSDSTDQIKRFDASGWSTREIDGHDYAQIEEAIAEELKTDSPSLIACKTTIGFGSPDKAGTSASHGAPLSQEEIDNMKKNLGWDYEPFEIPTANKDAWRLIGLKNTSERKDWEDRLSNIDDKKKVKFLHAVNGDISDLVKKNLQNLKQKYSSENPKLATRQSSQQVLEILNEVVEEMVGGSADLTPSNNTKTKNIDPISKNNFKGRFIHYGIREHGMAAAMNGMALHKGIIPYSGTFLIFSDYCRPSIRLAALMGIKVIHVMTHDSIGVGEDGPTHQPIEQIPSLRSIPNLNVFRPGDATEVAECWEIAISSSKPSILALSRQGCEHFRDTYESSNKCELGGYEVGSVTKKPKVCIIATGSEVSIAIDVKTELEKEEITCKVVSMPSFELFEKQSYEYKKTLLETDGIRIGIEASVGTGWEKYLGDNGFFVGMKDFGASAPASDLFEYFKINKENVLNIIKENL